MPPHAPSIRTEGLVGTERLREALRLIHESGAQGLSREALRQGMGGVSLRTVDRALALMESQGAVLRRDKSSSDGAVRYILEKGPAWDEQVSSHARLALCLATQSLSHAAPSFLEGHLDHIEALVNERMSARDRRLFETLQKAVRIHGGVEDPVQAADVLEPILHALESGRELEIDYRKAGMEAPRTRTVAPFGLTLDIFSGGSFLAAWDPVREAPKHFRLCRIQEARVGRNRARISDPVAMEHATTYQIGGWISGDPPFTVKARIRGTHWIEHFREAPPALPEFETREREGHVDIQFKANHLNGATRWLLQFGSMAEVLEPESMREHVRQELRAALEAHT